MRQLPYFISRRSFIRGAVAGSTLLGISLSPVVQAAFVQRINSISQTLKGKLFKLSIGYQKVNYIGRQQIATTVNQTVPGPTLRWREGDRVTLQVTNHLAQMTSIHWHGIILPTEMDGVPGLSFSGIAPGQTFTYQFDVQQSGTFWYHSHSGFQEQTGLYGAIIIDPKTPDPIGYDREYVVVLSDWSDQTPEQIYTTLKQLSHYYNFKERTIVDLWQEIRTKGVRRTWRDRYMWQRMRMSDRDIADVTGYTYTYLMNGTTPEQGWRGLFKAGEKVRLRFINAAAMTLFDVRIPDLPMTVVAADGQAINPVTVDEFRMGVAETYDVIVTPKADRAYTIFAQNIDRSGYTWGTLTPDVSWRSDIPAMDPAPILTHRDMGMQMTPDGDHRHHKPKHHDMDHNQHGQELSLGKAGFGSQQKIILKTKDNNPGIDMQVANPLNGLTDPGIGLRQHKQLYGRRVLTYADITNLYPTQDPREPSREIQLHLTGNMRRYIWSFDGVPYSDAEPILLQYGERLRITLVNDTMMTHPIHLHGMWSELETEDPQYIPRKHTIIVHPGSKISYLVTADAKGRWAYHCHLMYHMLGMFREVRVE